MVPAAGYETMTKLHEPEFHVGTQLSDLSCTIQSLQKQSQAARAQVRNLQPFQRDSDAYSQGDFGLISQLESRVGRDREEHPLAQRAFTLPAIMTLTYFKSEKNVQDLLSLRALRFCRNFSLPTCRLTRPI